MLLLRLAALRRLVSLSYHDAGDEVESMEGWQSDWVAVWVFILSQTRGTSTSTSDIATRVFQELPRTLFFLRFLRGSRFVTVHATSDR